MRPCYRRVLLAISLPLTLLGSLSLAPVVAASKATPELANIASAGSLQLLMDKYLGPPFIKSTGDEYQNQSAGSEGLAQEIVAGELTPNVFMPIGAAPMQLLQPKFSRWALRFAASPLVLAYYPKGRYAAQLKKIARGKLPIKDLFRVMAKPGFKLGRTDPALDPQGQGFIMMVQLAEKYLGVSPATAAADLGGAHGSSQIYSETGLEPTLQAGQLDAASAYLPQAVQLGLPYVTLPAKVDFGDPKYASIYRKASLTLSTGQTVHGSLLDLEASVLRPDGDRAAATAFVRFLLRKSVRRLMRNQGYTLLAPTILGRESAAPASLRAIVAQR